MKKERTKERNKDR